MPTTIKLKNSVTTTSVPSSLVQGEVAINITDKKVWVGNAATTPIQLLGGGADGTFTNISVSGVATFGAGTVSAPSITTTGDTNTGIFFPAADTIAFTEGGVESMRIDSSGNVGIGTTTADGKLTIETANSNTPRIRFQNASFDGDAAISTFVSSTGTDLVLGSNLYINSSGNLARFDSAQAGSYVYAGRTGNLFFGTNDSSGVATERMRIDSSGNVGIGTTTPFGTAANRTVLSINGTTDSNFTMGSGGSQRTYYVASSSQVEIATVGALPFLFSTNAAERMRIDSSGNAMIGTTTAGLKLTVQDGVTIVSGDQSGCRLVLQNTTSPGRTFSLVAGTVGVGNDDFTIYDNTASATRVTLKANGEFIIGTSDQGAYNLQCNGTGVWGAGAYVNGSDARIKEDIAPIESGLDVVKKLNPVTYRYKKEWSKDQSTQTGFIAQELLTALSGQVYVDGVVQQGGEYMSVAYQNIIPILTKAIQELNAKVEAQAAEIALLKSK
jgi:hypothetical protein